MQRLIDGVHRFQENELGRYRELFHRLAREGQRPHTLFITCADSRVLAELITQSQPGDLFVVKNVGNIVPPSHVQGSTNSTAAAIEFAVEVLEVDDVVVCGHSQCGAVRALMESTLAGRTLHHLGRWLALAEPVRRTVEQRYGHLQDPEDRIRAAEEENVLFALENLKTYPVVERRLAEGRLHLHAWFYRIGDGGLFAYSPVEQQFLPIQKPGP